MQILSRTLSLLLITVIFSSTIFGQEISEEERAAGFVSLFNGKDFVGWSFDGMTSPPQTVPANWSVENGVILLSGGGAPNLSSAKSYQDFEMKFEWRASKPKYNSGFYIRSGKKVGANQINLAAGAEGKFLGNSLEGNKAVPELQKPAGEWNEWRVLVVGNKVSFFCNGKPAWEATGIKPAEGHVGLQAEGARMEFRNLRIREIKSTSTP